MRLEPIVTLLENAGLGTAGTDIFVNFIPAEKSGILLRDDYSGTKVDPDLPGFFRAKFNLIVRTQEYVAGRDMAFEAIKQLKAATKHGTVVDSVTFKYIRALTLPIAYPPSPGQNFEFAVRMEACFVDLT